MNPKTLPRICHGTIFFKISNCHNKLFINDAYNLQFLSISFIDPKCTRLPICRGFSKKFHDQLHPNIVNGTQCRKFSRSYLNRKVRDCSPTVEKDSKDNTKLLSENDDHFPENGAIHPRNTNRALITCHSSTQELYCDKVLETLETSCRDEGVIPSTSRSTKLKIMRKVLRRITPNECRPRLSFSIAQRQLFARIMQCSDQVETTYLISKSNEMLSSGSLFQNSISSGAKQQIESYLEQHIISASEITKQQRQELESITQLKSQQISSLLYSMKQKPGKITQNAKDIILKWLQDHPNQMPTIKEKQNLEIQTGLSRSQVVQQLHYLKHKPVRISSISKTIIQAWWMKNQNRMPSTDERQLLMQQTGLSYQQLQSQLKMLKDKRKQSITPEAIAIIKEWMVKHKKIINIYASNRTDYNESQELLLETKHSHSSSEIHQSQTLTASSLEYFLRCHSSGHIMQWNNEEISEAERIILMNLTNLSKAQIDYVILSLKKEFQVTMDQWENIFNYILKNGFNLKKQNLSNLMSATNLSIVTLRKSIRRIKSKYNNFVSKEEADLI